MNYKEILDAQAENLRPDLQWWPRFFYHFTDVHNAASIIKSGWIYSRQYAKNQGIMSNDNASRAVMEATNFDNTYYGRLYFRPLTPTQYHNEGYKPVSVRNHDMNASCPVPVFFCLSSVATLNYPGTQFAERGIAGHRFNVKSGEDDFSKLNFSKIYHEGWYDTAKDGDIKEYRHSEIIRQGGFPLEPLLKCILCRTQAERETILYLLKSYSLRTYNSYKDRILYKPKLKCFWNNGIYIKRVYVAGDILQVEFNEPELRRKGSEENIPFQVAIDVQYRKQDGSILGGVMGHSSFDYCKIRSCEMHLKELHQCDLIRVQIKFDDAIMYENEIDIQEAELF